MDSAGFRTLVANYTNLTRTEAVVLFELSKKYPYSQLLHLMQARAARDLSSEDQVSQLHQAAVYAADRSILKFIMGAPTSPRLEPAIRPSTMAPNEQSIASPVVDVASDNPIEVLPILASSVAETQTLSAAPPPEIPLSDNALIDDIYLQLDKLRKSKHAFEVSMEQYEKSHATEVPSGPPRTTTREPADPLLEEIKSTKRKLKIENPRQKEQIEIIDQFIRTQPAIPKAKPVVASTDLAEDSGLFSDNIVSETLVDILLKQGKKEKAIEVLKKLIWKFPQKKAYFAAQIESLKN